MKRLARSMMIAPTIIDLSHNIFVTENLIFVTNWSSMIWKLHIVLRAVFVKFLSHSLQSSAFFFLT